jgi:hypothetical protein
MKVKLVLGAVFLIAFAAMFAALGVRPAQALCSTPNEEGRWINSDPNTRSITRAQVRFQCQDQVHNGQPYPPGDPFYVRLFGKCHPTDCEWAEVGLKRRSNGWLRGTIDHGFAFRTIWVRWYSPDDLRIYIWTDFRDNRRDYASDEWFVRS